MNIVLTPSLLNDFSTHLQEQEKSEHTISKYLRDVRAFSQYLGNDTLNKQNVLAWKESLISRYAPASVNSMLAAVNHFLEWGGFEGLKVKPLKIQRDIYSKPERELSLEEYKRLVRTAQQHSQRLALLLQTICATGIRVSELPFITVESIQTGRTYVTCKGKNRTVFLPRDLCRALRRYCRENQIDGGVIFRTRHGAALDRSNIWRDMKSLCQKARVSAQKVFPHNLRHLFARTYYRLEKDLSRLADLLGHSNVTTTRIYTMESGTEHAKQLNQMGLILLT